jgi:uncharacterized OB-fold protein
MSGGGRVLSAVVSRRGLPGIEQDLPLVVALIELDEGHRMMSNIVDVDVDQEIALDARVMVCFTERGEYALPMFTLVGAP